MEQLWSRVLVMFDYKVAGRSRNEVFRAERPSRPGLDECLFIADNEASTIIFPFFL
jgi:hypothetical protein